MARVASKGLLPGGDLVVHGKHHRFLDPDQPPPPGGDAIYPSLLIILTLLWKSNYPSVPRIVQERDGRFGKRAGRNKESVRNGQGKSPLAGVNPIHGLGNVLAPQMFRSINRRVDPEVWFRIVHLARDAHSGTPVATYREQLVEIALGPKGAFQNSNAGIPHRRKSRRDERPGGRCHAQPCAWRAGLTSCPGTRPLRPILRDHARSKRSSFITLVQAATKSWTNFECASELP